MYQYNKWRIVTGPGYIYGKCEDINQNEFEYLCIPPKTSLVVRGIFHTSCTYKPYTEIDDMMKISNEVDGLKTIICGPPDSGKSFHIEHISKINESKVGNIDTMQPIIGHPMTQSTTKRKKIILQDEQSNEIFSPHTKFNEEWFKSAKKIIKRSEIINIPGGGIPEQYKNEIIQMVDKVINLKMIKTPKTIYDRRSYTYWMAIKDNKNKIEINDIIGDNKLRSAPNKYKKRYIGQVVGLFNGEKFEGTGIIKEIHNSEWVIETYINSANNAKLSPLKIMPKQFNSIKKSLKCCDPNQNKE